MSCFPRGVRIVAERTYFRIFPVTRFVSFFSYTTSIYLTVTLIIERYVHLVRFSNMGCQIYTGMHIKENQRKKTYVLISAITNFWHLVKLSTLIFGKKLSNFVSLPWKLDNPYYHSKHLPISFLSTCEGPLPRPKRWH